MKRVFGQKSRITAIALTLFLLIPLFAFPSYAAESGKCGASLNWTLTGSTLTISGSGAMTDYVDEEMAPWYEFRDSITRVIFPDGMTHIGSQSFYACDKIGAITMPRSITSVGSYAFAECTGITTVITSAVLAEIEEGAFTECTSLSNIRLPSTLKKIGNKAFYRCYSLRAVTIPASVTEMGAQAFAYCEGLVKVTVNAKIASLPAWSFYGCESLISVSLSDTVKDTGNESFTGCTNLGSVFSQTYDIAEAEEIQKQIENDVPGFSDNGYVAPYDQPSSVSFLTTEEPDGAEPCATVLTTLHETDNSVITVVQTITDNDNGTSDTQTSIEAFVSGDAGWEELIKQINAGSDGDSTPRTRTRIDTVVNVDGTIVSSDVLKQLTGASTDLTIITSEGVAWTIDTNSLVDRDMPEVYDLSVDVQRTDEESLRLLAEGAYYFKFNGSLEFPATVGIPLAGQSLNAATLFAAGSEDKLFTVMVDKDGFAWFPFERVEAGSEFNAGINVLDTKQKDVVIPKTMFDAYGGLTDENGVKYEITGRSSKWGITGGQFALYVGAAILAIVLIVTVIMLARNHSLKMKNEARRRAEEREREEKTEVDKDELYEEVLRDMLKDKEQGDGKEKDE